VRADLEREQRLLKLSALKLTGFEERGHSRPT
jgi:hypothetical protein